MATVAADGASWIVERCIESGIRYTQLNVEETIELIDIYSSHIEGHKIDPDPDIYYEVDRKSVV